MFHVSCVTCHMSYVVCPLSFVTFHLPLVTNVTAIATYLPYLPTPSKHNRTLFIHVSLLSLKSWCTIQVNKDFVSLSLC